MAKLKLEVWACGEPGCCDPEISLFLILDGKTLEVETCWDFCNPKENKEFIVMCKEFGIDLPEETLDWDEIEQEIDDELGISLYRKYNRG